MSAVVQRRIVQGEMFGAPVPRRWPGRATTREQAPSASTPADWLSDRLHAFAQDVGSLVPEGYEAYARVLHPIVAEQGSSRTWRAVAEANGRIVHPEMQLHTIQRPPGTPAPTGDGPGVGFDPGSLPLAERRVLVEVLRDVTSTPDRCWFCVWEGFADVDSVTVGGSERVQHPGRQYLLSHGPMERALESFAERRDQSPNIWWPEDRAWVVATEVDLAWTYVAGTESTIARLLADDRLEALPAAVSHRFTYDSDLLNAALDGSGDEPAR